MAANTGDGAAVRFPPPLVYLAALAAGALLQDFALRLPVVLDPALRIAAAVAAALCGGALIAGALRLFRQTGQDPEPWKSTPEIIASGVYRITRNPMYLGMALLQVALGLGLANGWMLLFVPPVLVAVYSVAVRHEEAYLEQKFGESYVAYRRAVRRWI